MHSTGVSWGRVNSDCYGSYKTNQRCGNTYNGLLYGSAAQFSCLLTAVSLHIYSCLWGTAAGVSAALIFHTHQEKLSKETTQRGPQRVKNWHKMAGFRDIFFLRKNLWHAFEQVFFVAERQKHMLNTHPDEQSIHDLVLFKTLPELFLWGFLHTLRSTGVTAAGGTLSV